MRFFSLSIPEQEAVLPSVLRARSVMCSLGRSHSPGVMGFLELRQARGVNSRVTLGMPILNGTLFSEVRTLVKV